MASKKALEFRRDPVSGEWVLVSPRLIKNKPVYFKKIKAKPLPKSKCPFEHLNDADDKERPLLWLPKLGKNEFKDWWVEIIPNKYPVVEQSRVCPEPRKVGIHEDIGGVGFQEVVITRSHERSLGKMKKEEIMLILEAYQSRYQALRSEPCVEYILIFHNHGSSAGATIPHPHSQILAVPIIPPDVYRSLKGSAKYYREHNKRCVHCDILSWELKEKLRVIYKNDSFAAFLPYSSKANFEVRIFPLRHEARFEVIDAKQREDMADVMQNVFSRVYSKLNNPDYNFFIHTAPPKGKNSGHYHWHMEVLPRLEIPGGFELGAGIDVVRVAPEDAAKILKK